MDFGRRLHLKNTCRLAIAHAYVRVVIDIMIMHMITCTAHAELALAAHARGRISNIEKSQYGGRYLY